MVLVDEIICIQIRICQKKFKLSNEVLDFKVLAGLGIDINFLETMLLELDSI